MVYTAPRGYFDESVPFELQPTLVLVHGEVVPYLRFYTDGSAEVTLTVFYSFLLPRYGTFTFTLRDVLRLPLQQQQQQSRGEPHLQPQQL